MGCTTAKQTADERKLETKGPREMVGQSDPQRTLLYARRLADPPEFRSDQQLEHKNNTNGLSEDKSNDKVEHTSKDIAEHESNGRVEHNGNHQNEHNSNDKDEHKRKDLPVSEHTSDDKLEHKNKEEVLYNTEDQLEIKHLDRVLSTKVKSDRNLPSVQDIAVMCVDGVRRILMADDSNDCLKLFDNRKGKDEFQSVLSLTSSPFQIAVLKESSSIALTLPLEKRILMVSLDKTLKLKSKLETDKEYFGLTALDGSKLACGAPLEYPPCIDIIDSDGTVLSSFSTADNYGGLFADLAFISRTREGELLIVDPKDHALVCTSASGVVVWRYEPRWKERLISPAGVVCDDVGRVYVADANRRVVVQISQDGHKITEFSFSSVPHALSYCDGTLYVSAKSGHFGKVSG
ncbi:uncharacterized protein LOC121377384 [Gigantopelta aegis]|uniref:uncharacterized protein LOC121377384 n=1 Tax=Gigantopelta aegis TaxID=1735272 RepID=UPI001B88C6AE|nr:uncharacterized protein LOC121377384 [Gigantopelta aegis]